MARGARRRLDGAARRPHPARARAVDPPGRASLLGAGEEHRGREPAGDPGRRGLRLGRGLPVADRSRLDALRRPRLGVPRRARDQRARHVARRRPGLSPRAPLRRAEALLRRRRDGRPRAVDDVHRCPDDGERVLPGVRACRPPRGARRATTDARSPGARPARSRHPGVHAAPGPRARGRVRGRRSPVRRDGATSGAPPLSQTVPPDRRAGTRRGSRAGGDLDGARRRPAGLARRALGHLRRCPPGRDPEVVRLPRGGSRALRRRGAGRRDGRGRRSGAAPPGDRRAAPLRVGRAPDGRRDARERLPRQLDLRRRRRREHQRAVRVRAGAAPVRRAGPLDRVRAAAPEAVGLGDPRGRAASCR